MNLVCQSKLIFLLLEISPAFAFTFLTPSGLSVNIQKEEDDFVIFLSSFPLVVIEFD